MKDYILYGAGKYVSCFLQLILFFKDNVVAIVDGDCNKQGKNILGINVFSPNYLLESDDEIIISCMATDEIRLVLKKMNIDKREVRIGNYLARVSKHREETFKYNHNSVNYVFDLYSGAHWGGAENWNYYVAEHFKRYNSEDKVAFVADDCKELYSLKSVPIVRFDRNDDIKVIADALSLHGRICFVNSFFSLVFFAAVAAKISNPDAVKLVTVVHNDYKDLYKICDMFKDYTDLYICVSSKIRDTLVENYSLSSHKICFLPQPIEYKDTSVVRKECDEIRIGVATRLTKQQKRVDYLPLIIEELEKKNICYKLQIAGDGEYYDLLEDFIIKQRLSGHIELLGRIEHERMWDFWNGVDVFLSFSDFEGSSLSMLEAMSCGCVPVVTDVSGTRDYIVDGENGYILDIGDIDGICNSIEQLYKNKESMVLMGNRSRNIVINKCNIDTYEQRLTNLLQDIVHG